MGSYWLRPFYFITLGPKFYRTCHFHKMIVQNNIKKKKTFTEKPNNKTFEN